MSKAAKAFAVVFVVCVLLVGFAPVVNAGTVTWRVIAPNYIKDLDGTTNLAVGSYVQLWDVTDADRPKHVLLVRLRLGMVSLCQGRDRAVFQVGG